MKTILATLLAGAALLAAPVADAQRHRATPDEKLAKLLEGRVAGKPVDCISLSRTGASQVIEGKAIVYTVGNTLYVNELRGGADQLDDNSILVTNTFGSQLCSIDTVRLIDRVSFFPRGFVSLGEFVPYSKPKKSN
ncbi:hypothetical protein [Sphingomonas sp. R1]|uniref:hypothetical protein n=1 Tax=Sphingomonas sp. R1 TaxID=399176 RepID=UPI002224A1F0|nr:hypothetical protein [Sphingomonas sp. R1]UYY78359.1 hypothetical protein OIM94_04985 [Sphingomonas sp. R1]